MGVVAARVGGERGERERVRIRFGEDVCVRRFSSTIK